VIALIKINSLSPALARQVLGSGTLVVPILAAAGGSLHQKAWLTGFLGTVDLML
jgi:hypothetical protein